MAHTAEVTLSNATAAVNFSSWTAAQLKAATNISNYAPSAKDLVMAGPRMAMKLGSFAIYTITEAFDNALGLGMAQRVIPEATGAGGVDVAATAGAALGNMAEAAGDTMAEINNGGGYTGSLSLDSVRNFGGLFSYATSKWALMSIFMAVALNRTYVYSSTRRNLTLGWKARLALRITPILLFAIQSISLLQSIQCQTSPDFSELRWGNASRSSELLFIQRGGLFHTISQGMLLGASDKASCQAIGMIAPDLEENDERDYIIPIGSFQRLWPLFETLCFSQFVETISCAVQGRLVAAENGMTLFEHSLAFAEAEANINSIIGLGASSKSTGSGFTYTYSSDPEKDSTEVVKRRTTLIEALNTSPEVLFIALISSMNHLTSHVLGVFNMQGRLRLINTGFWGLAFMGTISWSFFAFSGADDGNHSLLRFPTVCIVGFVPHMLVLAGIILCCVIYFFALIVTALASPSTVDGHRLSWYEKFKAAHDNLQADIPMSSIRVSMHMDFYTALLKSGFQALTMASEAVYLNESKGVRISGTTWLEEERLADMDENGADWLGPSFRSQSNTSTEKLNAMDLLQESTSGFARERTAKKLSKRQRPVQDGVGAAQRTGRWIMAADFFTGIAKLLIGLWAKSILRSLSLLNIRRRPQWLQQLAGQKEKGDGSNKNEDSTNVTLDFWLINNNGELTLPVDEHVDIEQEMKKRLGDGQPWDVAHETDLDSSLYNWWLRGGWWGVDDSSGDFAPPDVDDDTTSMISMSTNHTTSSDWESDSNNSNDDGRRTPTQRSPHFTRESTPITDTPLSISDLARLLHPQTPEQRAESETLASHMASDSILTRSRYRSLHQQKRARVLTSTRIRPAGFRPRNANGRLTAAEEAEILEFLIVTRRAAKAGESGSVDSNGASWATGAAGLGEGGPQCVVCQSSPRSIIVWPCRCLSLCDDCRVTLAMNNYEKCVCCRGDVNSFSRIFVP